MSPRCGVATSASVPLKKRLSTGIPSVSRWLFATAICAVLIAPTIGSAAVQGTLTGVVVAEREDADGETQLLLATPATVGGEPVDEIRLEVPPKFAKRITVERLPPGWEMTSRRGIVTCTGPPVTSADTVAIALGVDPRLVPDSVGLELLSDGQPVMAGNAISQKLPRVGEASPPADAIAIPEVVTPGDPVTFIPLDSNLTPPGGEWIVGGQPAVWNGSFDRPEYTWTPPIDAADLPVGDLPLEYIDPWGHLLVDGTAQTALSDPAGESSDEAQITGCSPKVLTGAIFCVCGTFPDENSRRGVTLNGQALGAPLSSARHVLKFRLPEETPPGPFKITGDREAGFDESDTASGTHIAVGGEVDRERLRSGESTPLRLWLEGTEEPVSLHLWNRTPAIVSLEGGEDQIVTTSGGTPNQVERIVHAVMPGDFHLSYELELGSCPCSESYTSRIATLITSVVTFASGQDERFVWLRVPASGTVELRSPQPLTVAVYTEGGAPAAGDFAGISYSESEIWEMSSVDFRRESNLAYLALERSGDLEEQIDVLVTFRIDDLDSIVFWEENPGDRFFSPYRRFPSGKETIEVLAPQQGLSMESMVEDRYGYSAAMGTTFLSYATAAGILTLLCPSSAAGPQTPKEIEAPDPPGDSKHKENYCGVSHFINSMEYTFPGAIPKDCAKNGKSFDKVAENINHSSLIGTPATHLVAGVNRSYFFGRKALDGKRYCAWELKDVSVNNIRAWHKECDVKVVIYDVDPQKRFRKKRRGDKAEKSGGTWAHWLNVVSIDGREFLFQDYNHQVKARYITPAGDDNYLDFSVQRTTVSTVRDRFDNNDPKAGDDAGESIHFVAVCECDDSWVTYEIGGTGPTGDPALIKTIRPPPSISRNSTNIRFP